MQARKARLKVMANAVTYGPPAKVAMYKMKPGQKFKDRVTIEQTYVRRGTEWQLDTLNVVR